MTTQRHISVTAQHSNTRGKGKRLRRGKHPPGTSKGRALGETGMFTKKHQPRNWLMDSSISWQVICASVLGDTVTEALCAAVLAHPAINQALTHAASF